MKGRSFSKASIGAVIGHSGGSGGSTFQFSGSRASTAQATKAIVAAHRYRQQMQLRKGETARQSRSSLSAGEQSAIRGAQRSARRFAGENSFFND